MTCVVDECESVELVATATNPITGEKSRVCEVHARLFDRLDDHSREQYRAIGDPRADRDRLVVWEVEVS